MSPAEGFRCFFAGWRAARAPGLGRYTWGPAALSLLVVAAGLAVTFEYAAALADRVTRALPEWLSFLGALVAPLLYVLGILAGTWLFGLLAAILASPFLGDLSLAVERDAFGTRPAAVPSWWRALPGSLRRELRKLAYHLPRLLAVFVLSLVPLLNAAAPLLWLGFGAWTLAIQFCDYPNENRGRPFRDTVSLLARNRLAALGFGLCASVALAVPLINVMLIPAAVAGGTLLWGRMQGGGLNRHPGGVKLAPRQ